ncbi:MAG: class I SAM-dependent methyltransferase [Lysobacterales bacterium]|nr:MAG: class I SAM-dependent methyltransferase [Xanthomonadales bacterium]
MTRCATAETVLSDKLEPTGPDMLEFTGERFTPECLREIRYEHVHRYAFACDLVRGRVVLDAACGEGYGARLLATAAARVTGVDLSAAAVEHARGRYRLPNLSFEAADCRRLPFADGSFDCVVSFETLEHLADQDDLLREFRRVLQPAGFLLISSPDKAVYSERLGNRNEYHVRELYRDELEALLRAHFPACRLWGQKLGFHSAIWSLEPAAGVAFQQESGGEIRQGSAPLQDPVYFLALCAATEAALPAVGAGLNLFDDAGESVYAHYYHEIRKNMAAGEVLAGRERELERLKTELAASRVGSPGARSWWRRLFGRE